jgi:methionine sulfoxide reductase heme-binding subunit
MAVSKMSSSSSNRVSTTALVALGLILAVLGGLTVVIVAGGYSPLDFVRNIFDQLFAASSVQAMWYITRAAGLMSYLLLWLSTVWGLAVSNKILDPVLQRMFTYDFHQFISLLAIGFIVLHIVVLLADQYLPFSVAQILVPFAAPYRPVWVGLGTIGLYLTLLVSITFYLRRRIGQKAFRAIHLASYLAFLAAALHGLLSGTDSPLITVRLMYLSTTLIVVFLTAYRVMMSAQAKRQRAALQGRK